MELTINNSSYKFTDYLHVHNDTKRNSDSAMKPVRVKHNKQFLSFNKWFQKEHDYCLPNKEQNAVSFNIPGPYFIRFSEYFSFQLVQDDKVETNFNDFDEIRKSLNSDSLSLDSSKTTKNLENINVNNELSSCSVYAIDVTTE